MKDVNWEAYNGSFPAGRHVTKSEVSESEPTRLWHVAKFMVDEVRP